jgi:hypothetical protein
MLPSCHPNVTIGMARFITFAACSLISFMVTVNGHGFRFTVHGIFVPKLRPHCKLFSLMASA